MQIEHLNKETTDGTMRNLDALYQLFPSCFTEAKDVITGKMHRAVDWGKLRELLGEYVENDEPEKYDFTWVGKRAAQREAAAPCRKTLRPCPEESVTSRTGTVSQKQTFCQFSWGTLVLCPNFWINIVRFCPKM